MKYLLVGGSGTLGTELIRQFGPNANITIMSREELKQKNLKAQFPYVKCLLGDVKSAHDYEMVVAYVKPDAIFHLAAIKHVEIAEENPEECVAVNLVGTMNGAQAAIRHKVKWFVFSSTDKAVLPINIYGATKFASEKYLFELNRREAGPNFSVFRWGNVLGSRGSVIHSFVKSLKATRSVQITDESMTRFWINIDDVANFMRGNYFCAHKDRAMLPDMKAASILRLADLTADHLGIEDYQIDITGIRPGEKYHECLWSEHDVCIRSDTCEQYTDDELRELIRKSLC
jgi:UDP-N-acetylglucosamine 4,6-dehydratase